jgi:hypothetical protein
VDAYSGRLTDWRELGGDPGPIRAIGREPTDASRQALNRRLIKPFENIAYGEKRQGRASRPGVDCALLDRFPTSLGVLNKSALGACNSKVVSFGARWRRADVGECGEGDSTRSWLELGLNLYKSEALTPAGQAFLEFVRSPAGERRSCASTAFCRPSPES